MHQLKLIKDRQLRAIARQYAKTYKKLAIPEKADGQCMDESYGFVSYAQRRLGKSKTVGMGIMDAGRHPHYCKHCSHKYDHFVVKFGRLRIDFTARQFHRNFAFPHVWVDSVALDAKVKGSPDTQYVY